MKHLFLTLFAFTLFLNTNTFSQSTIIIPFYKQGENKVSIIEDDPCYRKVETMIKEAALKEYDLQFIDYLALVRKLGKDQIRNIGSETDLIKRLIQESDPDIYVVADIEKYRGRSSSSGKTEYAFRINLTAFRTNTGRTMAATILDSGRRYYDDCHGLINKAFMQKDNNGASKIELFIQQLIINDVASLSIEFILASGSESKYTDKLTNGKLLVREISHWIRENSANNIAKPAGFGSNYISYREILMPTSEGSEFGYTTQDYALDLYVHLTELKFVSTDENLIFEFDVASNTITYKLQ